MKDIARQLSQIENSTFRIQQLAQENEVGEALIEISLALQTIADCLSEQSADVALFQHRIKALT